MLYNPAFRKIEYYLYNYNVLDIYIEQLKEVLSNYEYNQNYTRWIKNRSSSLEDLVIKKVNVEKRIERISKWKNLISEIIEEYRKENKLYYEFIKLKYLKKKKTFRIEGALKISTTERTDIQAEILQYICSIAIKKGMLEEVKL